MPRTFLAVPRRARRRSPPARRLRTRRLRGWRRGRDGRGCGGRRRGPGPRVVLPPAVRRRAGRWATWSPSPRSPRPVPSRTTSSSPRARSARSPRPTSCCTCPASRARSTRPSTRGSPEHVLDAAEVVDLVEGDAHDHAEDEHADEAHAAEEGHALDPHFWLDPQRLAALAGPVADALAEADPANADTFADGRRAADRRPHRARRRLHRRASRLRAPRRGHLARGVRLPHRRLRPRAGRHLRPRPGGRAVARATARDRRRRRGPRA